MNKELVEVLAGWLRDSAFESIIFYDEIAEAILPHIDKKGYTIIKKDDLIKEAGLIVSEKLGVKN